MGGFDEGGVVVRQREFFGWQAAGGGTHHARLPFAGGLVDPLPTQGRGQAAAGDGTAIGASQASGSERPVLRLAPRRRSTRRR